MREITDESRAGFARMEAMRERMSADNAAWLNETGSKPLTDRECDIALKSHAQGWADCMRLLRDEAMRDAAMLRIERMIP